MNYVVDAFHAGNDRDLHSFILYGELIYHSGDFEIVYSVLGEQFILLTRVPTSQAFLFSLQNHSCDPNCKINAVYINEANKFKPLMVIFTCRDVSAGEELCFSYFGDLDDEGETTDVHDSPVCHLLTLLYTTSLQLI